MLEQFIEQRPAAAAGHVDVPLCRRVGPAAPLGKVFRDEATERLTLPALAAVGPEEDHIVGHQREIGRGICPGRGLVKGIQGNGHGRFAVGFRHTAQRCHQQTQQNKNPVHDSPPA